MNKKGKTLLAGFVVLFLLFLVPKVISYFGYSKATGTVVNLVESTFRGGRRSTKFQYPVIHYLKADSSVGYYTKDNEVLYYVPSVGDKIIVLYNPDDDSDAYLNRFGSFWFSLPSLLIFGLLVILWIGLVNIIFVKPRKKKV